MRATKRRNVILAGVWAIVSAVAGSACGGDGDSVSIRPIEPGSVCPTGGTEFIINDESHVSCNDAQNITVVKVGSNEEGNPCVQGALKVTVSEPGKADLVSWVCDELRGDSLQHGAKEFWEALSTAFSSFPVYKTYEGLCASNLSNEPWQDPGYEEMSAQAFAIYEACLLPYLSLTEELSGNALTAIQCMIQPSIAQATCSARAATESNPESPTCDDDYSTLASNCMTSWDSGLDCAGLTLSAEESAAHSRFMQIMSKLVTSCPQVPDIMF